MTRSRWPVACFAIACLLACPSLARAEAPVTETIRYVPSTQLIFPAIRSTMAAPSQLASTVLQHEAHHEIAVAAAHAAWVSISRALEVAKRTEARRFVFPVAKDTAIVLGWMPPHDGGPNAHHSTLTEYTRK
jgi:hypothetical protein